MSLDWQVVTLAALALSLRLFVWSRRVSEMTARESTPPFAQQVAPNHLANRNLVLHHPRIADDKVQVQGVALTSQRQAGNSPRVRQIPS